MATNSESEKKNIEKASKIRGFEVELNNEKLTRIDKLVKNYACGSMRNMKQAPNCPTVSRTKSQLSVAAGPLSSSSVRSCFYGF